MTTDEEKSKIAKLLQELEVSETTLSERCSDLIRDFHRKFDREIEEEDQDIPGDTVYENPYRVDKRLLEENERKLQQLLSKSNRVKKESSDIVVLTEPDPKRPWRTHSCKEKLLRIDNELKRHLEMASQIIFPLAEDEMKELVKVCQEETSALPTITTERLRDTVDAAKKIFTHFQYHKFENTTATSIFPEAHELNYASTPQKTCN